MDDGGHLAAASGCEVGGSASGWKDDNTFSESPSPTPSPSASPLRPASVGAANVAATPGDSGIGVVDSMSAAAYPLPGAAGVETVLGSATALGNVAAGEDLAGKKRGVHRADGGVFPSSAFPSSPASAGEFSTGEKRRRGRPPGSGRRQILAVLGECADDLVQVARFPLLFLPHSASLSVLVYPLSFLGGFILVT